MEKKGITRRDFVKASMVTAAAAAWDPAWLSQRGCGPQRRPLKAPSRWVTRRLCQVRLQVMVNSTRWAR